MTVIQAFSDVEKPFLFSDFKAAKSENKKELSTSEKARIIKTGACLIQVYI